MFHSSLETIGDQKVLYYAVLFPAQAVNQGLLRQAHVSAAVREHMIAAQAAGSALDLKTEFHATLQFFSPPKAPGEVPGLASLLGSQVQVNVLYVASTPKIAAARLEFVRPQAVALACANACPHITLAVGTGAQAVWSNELLQVVEQKATTAPAQRVAEWQAARVVQFNNPEAGLAPMMLTGQVCAFVSAPRGGGGGGGGGHHGRTSKAAAAASAGRAPPAAASEQVAKVDAPQQARTDTVAQQQQQQQQQQQVPNAASGADDGHKRMSQSAAPAAAAAIATAPAAVVAPVSNSNPTESPMRREATSEPVKK